MHTFYSKNLEISGLSINPKIIRKIKELTSWNVQFDTKKIATEAVEKLDKESVIARKALLLQNEYIKLPLEIKEALTVYFYLLHNKGLDYKNIDFISLKSIQTHLEFKPTVPDKILNEYKFNYPAPCPACKKVVLCEFRGLKNSRLSKEIQCEHCKHIISDFEITSECQCEICQNIISDSENYFHNLPTTFENIIKPLINHLKEELKTEEITDDRLKWFANKHSADLSKTEREVISFKPKNIEEIEELFDRKLLDNLIKKKVVIERKILKDIKDIYFSLLSNFNLHCSTVGEDPFSGYNITLKDIDLTKLKIKSISYDKNTWSESLKLNFEGNSILMISEKELDRLEEISGGFLDFRFEFIHLNQLDFCKSIYDFNPYYFQKEEIENYPNHNIELIKPLFRSKVEKNKFHFLNEKYQDYIIMVNVRLFDLVDLMKIASFYTSEEIKYLRNCIIDFVFYNEDGTPIKVIELQRGNHHNSEEYIKKDKLKKSAISRAGILFEENF